MRHALLPAFALVVVSGLASSQNLVLNGDFEINTSSGCLFEQTSTQFNALMPHCTSFGQRGAGEGEIDIMEGDCGWGLAPPSGHTKLGLAAWSLGEPFGDVLSMDLASPLEVGVTYTLSFRAMANLQVSTTVAGVDVGLSGSPTAFGDLLFSGHPSAVDWTLVSFGFTATAPATELTVRNTPTETGWNHVDDFRLVKSGGPWLDLGNGLAGANGIPHLNGAGTLVGGTFVTTTATSLLQNSVATLVVGLSPINVPFKGGIWVPSMDLLVPGIPTGPDGVIDLPSTWPMGIPPGFAFYEQYWQKDPAGVKGFAASNAIRGLTP